MEDLHTTPALVMGETGLTPKEQEVMDHLVEAIRGFTGLEIEHPHELDDFLQSIHRLQDLLAIRVARRMFPEGWYRTPPKPPEMPPNLRYKGGNPNPIEEE